MRRRAFSFNVGVEQQSARRAHIPEVAGANPAAASRVSSPLKGGCRYLAGPASYSIHCPDTKREGHVRRIILLAALVAGCQTYDPATRARNYELARHATPVCMEPAECDRMWKAAVAWVSRHSGYKIQTATEGYLTTYGPIRYRTSLAVTVSMQPGKDGEQVIVASIRCAPGMTCRPDASEALLDFNLAVSGQRTIETDQASPRRAGRGDPTPVPLSPSAVR